MERRLLGRNEGRTDDNIDTIRKRFKASGSWGGAGGEPGGGQSLPETVTLALRLSPISGRTSFDLHQQ